MYLITLYRKLSSYNAKVTHISYSTESTENKVFSVPRQQIDLLYLQFLKRNYTRYGLEGETKNVKHTVRFLRCTRL